MKFHFKRDSEELRQPTLEDVDINQFFINKRGELCQKTTGTSYVVIANSDGEPYSDHYGRCEASEEISTIIKEVERIEF